VFYKCSICGAEVPDLPMSVLKHQLSHIGRRPLARNQPDSAADEDGPPSVPKGTPKSMA
jgi:hypothetical protein